MKKILLLLTLVSNLIVFANDGAYYTSGNQLIPIAENEISITKEILSVTRKVEQEIEYVYITVDYTFHNPSNAKNVLVGFEAPSPSGDVGGTPKNGAHPYMSDFKVEMNGAPLSFQTAMVNTDTYYSNGKIDAKTENELIDEDFNTNSPDFYYVYYFDAPFQAGVNKIHHTYKFNMSGSVMDDYSFDYILTAANRWANKQIDDFTLIIDMGPNQGFEIKNSFFKTAASWKIKNGRSIEANSNFTKFVIRSGVLTFKEKNFHPTGELYLRSLSGVMINHFNSFDYRFNNLPKEIDVNNTGTFAVDEDSHKILRNLPFAIRGYVFNTPFIQDYFLTQSWYMPHPQYKVNLDALNAEELDWLNQVKSNLWDEEE